VPPKKGDLVEVLVSSRNSPNGQVWVPATIEFIDDMTFPNDFRTQIRVRTLFGDKRADIQVYQPYQIRRMNVRSEEWATAVVDSPTVPKPENVRARDNYWGTSSRSTWLASAHRIGTT